MTAHDKLATIWATLTSPFPLLLLGAAIVVLIIFDASGGTHD